MSPEMSALFHACGPGAMALAIATAKPLASSPTVTRAQAFALLAALTAEATHATIRDADANGAAMKLDAVVEFRDGFGPAIDALEFAATKLREARVILAAHATENRANA